MSPDVAIVDHGSIILVFPLTRAARRWIDENVSDDAQWFGRGLVVEPRYLANLINGMEGDGLAVGDQ